MNPQQIGPAWAFVVQVFDDHHKTLSPAAAASFKVVGQQHLNTLEQVLAAATAPKKRATKKPAAPAV